MAGGGRLRRVSHPAYLPYRSRVDVSAQHTLQQPTLTSTAIAPDQDCPPIAHLVRRVLCGVLLLSYNPAVTPSLTIPSSALILDVSTITQIYFSCLFNFNDSKIVSLNPAYAAELNSTEEVITQNVGCGTTAAQAPISYAILDRMTAYQAAHPEDVALADCVNGYTEQLYEDWYNCVSVPSLNVFYAPTETTVPPLVLGTTGAMGMMVVDGDPTLGVPTMLVNSGGENVSTTSDVGSIAACAQGVFDPDSLSFDTESPVNNTCWPWTQQVVAMVRKNYVSSASVTSAEACSRGLSALQYLQWLFTSTEVDSVTTSSNVVRLPSLTADVQAAFVSALNGVLCDGSTLLITLPTEWQVSAGLSSGVSSVCFIAAALCVGCIVYTFIYRNHPVIRSSSPIFLSTSLFGVVILLFGTAGMVQPATLASCGAVAWLWSVGFSLTFAPLFAKTWRIYRIFGRKKLSVVKISNRRLATLVYAILLLDIVLMSVWQALSPLQPYTTTVYTGSNPVVQNDYHQCGVEGDGRTMLALVAVSKGVLLLFGALMAFTTRKVSSTFNESSGIALAIYNVLFSIGIIAPIILVIDAIGDVLVLLLLFLGLWVSCFTAAILFVPKLLVIHGSAGQQMSAAEMSKVSSSGQYSFLSLAQLSTVPVVMSYVAALKSHLTVAERRLAELKAKQANRSSVEPSASPPQHRRGTLSTQRDGLTPTTHHRLLDDGAGVEESAVLAAHSQPRQRSAAASQVSPVQRDKRAVGRSSRADGGEGGGGPEVSSSGVGGPMLADMGMVRGSSESEQVVAACDEVEECEPSTTGAIIGAVNDR